MISVIFDDESDLAEGRRRVAERLARVQGQLPAGANPELTPDARGDRPDLLVHRRGRQPRPGPAARDPGLVRPAPARLGPRASPRSRASAGSRSSTRSCPTPTGCGVLGVSLSEVLEAVVVVERRVGRTRRPQGKRRVRRAGRRLAGRIVHARATSRFDPDRALRDLENVVVPLAGGGTIRLAEVAEVAIGPGFRRGVLEKDGNEVTGGVILMARGENPLEVTRRIKAKIRELQTGLPRGVRIVPFYDRTPLIEGAIGTVTGTVVEAMISASLCVLVILLHVRTSLVIASTLPLAALSSFLIMAVLRRPGMVDIQANAMSLAGIAISIGVLVDSSVVMAENVMHRLREHFGGRAGARRRPRRRPAGLPGGRAADRLLGGDHGAVVPARLRAGRDRGEDVPSRWPTPRRSRWLAVAVLAITLVPALARSSSAAACGPRWRTR